ncbi:hypothetical protein [Microcoleus sp. LEGE 07076]|uniref:hypothetical protein n=1 Tax=Microcoleus sp. LEGE 07076 TaxID=915322 RepID=UPI001D14D548|nr:hypothetical protein [Microcoleus sp. LEGE 07076]
MIVDRKPFDFAQGKKRQEGRRKKEGREMFGLFVPVYVKGASRSRLYIFFRDLSPATHPTNTGD